jgi:hypothetical protein
MNIFKGTRLERAFQPGCEGWTLLLSAVWIISAIVVFLVPLIYRTIQKKKYEQVYMSYYWEKEYEYNEQQRKENYEKYGNSYNYGGAYMYGGNYGNREYMDVNKCRWWQLNCFSYFVNQDGEPMPEQGWYPNWYSGWALTEEERQEMEDGREQPGSLKFVYAWQALVFFGIVWYGLTVIRQHRNPTGLIIALFVWANFAFLSMWLMADGSIVTDGQRVKRYGFYGQMSVLIFMSNFWYLLHGFAFALVFWIRKVAMDQELAKSKESAQKLAEHEESVGVAARY